MLTAVLRKHGQLYLSASAKCTLSKKCKIARKWNIHGRHLKLISRNVSEQFEAALGDEQFNFSSYLHNYTIIILEKYLLYGWKYVYGVLLWEIQLLHVKYERKYFLIKIPVEKSCKHKITKCSLLLQKFAFVMQRIHFKFKRWVLLLNKTTLWTLAIGQKGID